MSKIKIVGCMSNQTYQMNEVCLICPMLKLTKFPYNVSTTGASNPFELLHIDTWGAYRVKTYNGLKHFMTIVDD